MGRCNPFTQIIAVHPAAHIHCLSVLPDANSKIAYKAASHTKIKGVAMKFDIKGKLPSVALVFLATWLLLILPNMG